MARRFVRFAGDAARKTAVAPRSAPARQVVKAATRSAAVEGSICITPTAPALLRTDWSSRDSW